MAGAIKAMTETHLRQKGTTVSAKPVVMRAEYALIPHKMPVGCGEPGALLITVHAINIEVAVEENCC